MESFFAAKKTTFGLFKSLTGDSRTLLRQELQLARTELSEKISKMGRNAATLAVGAFVVYAGLIVLFIGMGWLLAWAFAMAGLNPMFAGFLGLALVGLLVIAIGSVLLLKAIKTLSHQRLAPQRAIHILEELKAKTSGTSHSNPEPAEKPSSKELQNRVQITEGRLEETLDELKHRLSPSHINAQIKRRLDEHPYRAGVIAMAAGLLSGVLIKNRWRARHA